MFTDKAAAILSKIPISNINYDCATTNLEITSQVFGTTYTIIPGVLKLQHLSFTLLLDSSLKPTVIFNGEATIVGQLVQIRMTYHQPTHQFDIVSNFSGPSLNIEHIVKEIKLPFPSLPTADISFYIEGTVDEQSNGILIIESILNAKDKAFVVLNNIDNAVAVDVARIKLSDLLQKMLGQDISSIPFFGSLMLPDIGLSVSNKAITSDLIRDRFSDTNMLRCFDDTIPRGLAGCVQFDFSSDVFKIAYEHNRTFSFKIQGSSFSVRDLLKNIPGVDTLNIKLPAGIDNILDISIDNFGLDLLSKSIPIKAKYSKTLSYFNGFLQLSDPTIVLNVSPLDGYHGITFEASGKITFASVEFTFMISMDKQHKFYLDATTPHISTSSLLSSFSAKLLPDILQPIAKSLPFLNFGINDFHMVLPLGAPSSQIFLSGKPEIAGYTIIDMSATVIRAQAGDMNMVFDLNLGDLNFAGLLGQIAPFAAGPLKLMSFLDQLVKTDLTISPSAFSDIKLSKVAVPIPSIKEGITVRAAIPLPDANSCSKDPFCVVAKKLLPPGLVLHVDTTIASVTNFQLVASLTGDIKIPGGLTITHAGVEVRVGEETSIGIIGSIALSNPRLDFTARIYSSATGVVIEMIMAGCWNQAFGIPIVDICNIHGSMGLGATTIITEVSLGGEVRLGVGSCQGSHKPITAIGHVGLNTVEPQNNYYYVSYPQGLSLNALLWAFCVDTKLIPSPIGNTGLKPGFIFSFTAGPTGKTIPEINLHIPAGLHLSGGVNILGLEAYASISASPSVGINASIALPPLNAGGLFYMYKSSADHSRGPNLICDLRPPQGHVSVEAHGVVSVLGITAEAHLSMSKEHITTSVEGNILGIVEAKFALTAPLTDAFSSAQFQVAGYFKNSFFSTIENAIKKAAKKTADAATSAIDAAKNVVKQKDEAFKAANSQLDSAKSKVSGAQGDFNNGQRKVNDLQHKIDNICHHRSCGSGKSCDQCNTVMNQLITLAYP